MKDSEFEAEARLHLDMVEAFRIEIVRYRTLQPHSTIDERALETLRDDLRELPWTEDLVDAVLTLAKRGASMTPSCVICTEKEP